MHKSWLSGQKWTSAPTPNNYNNHSAEANTYFIKGRLGWEGVGVWGGGTPEYLKSEDVGISTEPAATAQATISFQQNWVRAVTRDRMILTLYSTLFY